MSKTLCYITKNMIINSQIEEIARSNDFEVKALLPSGFMVELWANRPDLVIVDIESIGEQGVISIESGLESEYVPTFYVYTQLNPKWEILELNGHLISFDKCIVVLKDLMMSSVITGMHYKQISSNYETMKLMNEEFDTIVDAYMSALRQNEPSIIDEFLSLVYTDNFLMHQIPKWFVVLNQNIDYIEGWIFGLGLDEVSHFKEENFVIQPYIDKAAEAGLYVNFTNEAMSDVNSIEQIVPSVVLSYFDHHFINFDSNSIESITSFGVNKTLYIGIDYVEPINGYDLAVFKGVCDKINKLQIIKSNVSDLQESFIYTMDALARAAESKDDVTGHHIKRVNDYSALIAKEIGMDDSFINNIQISAQMHDVGKISISELILNKPGRLTDDEFDEMKKHTTYGASIVGESKNLKMARRIARSHHEKYDGTGYPQGLKGDEIPMEARIVSLADIYDALRSPRSYKEGFTHEKAYEIIVEGDGRVMPEHFDQNVLEAFKRVHEVMRHIYDAQAD